MIPLRGESSPGLFVDDGDDDVGAGEDWAAAAEADDVGAADSEEPPPSPRCKPRIPPESEFSGWEADEEGFAAPSWEEPS